jgi:sulfate permease, SulP family
MVPAKPSSKSEVGVPVSTHTYTPQIVTVLREGYGARELRADALAGLTVAIVALPLSMALAIAAGLSPDRGLYAAIVGGFMISLLGGSRYQIGGPAGAFIVLIYSIVERHGYDGLVIATMMAGVMMVAAGILRLGTYIRHIPQPVIIGFTAGIAVIIFSSQLREILGLDLAKEPAAFWAKLSAIWSALGTVKPAAVAIAILAIGLVVGIRYARPKWPGLLIAVVVCSVVNVLFQLDIASIGSKFGALPNALPWPSLPELSLDRMRALLPDALAIAVLGAIESLLSAVVADEMSGERHRPNCELAAQGVGNIASVMFGGMCVTGTIARTATNIRSGAVGPVAGMLHAVYLLAFMMIAAPMAAYVPLACLGGVLAVIAWTMADRHTFVGLVRASPGEAVVLGSTFLLTITVDLISAIVVGVILAAVFGAAKRRTPG